MNQINQVNKERVKFLKREVFTDMQYTKAWFNKNIKRIVDTIESRYEKPSSRSSYFSSLAMIALAVSNDKDKAYSRFSKLATEYSWKHRDEREEGNLTENEKKNIKTFVNYSIHRELCYEKWINDKKNIQLMYRSLAMAMISLYPPLRRNDYLDLELIETLPPKPSDENFILTDKANKKCYWILNTPAKTKEKEMAFRAGTYPLNSLLSARILETIEAFPRTYLFSTLKDSKESMSDGSFYKILDGIYSNQVVRLDYVRKSYECFVAKQNFSTKFRRSISHYLLHSLETVMSFYSKVDIPNEIENDKYNTTIAYVDADDVVVIKRDSTPDFHYKYPIVIIEEHPELDDEKNETIFNDDNNKMTGRFIKPTEAYDDTKSDDEQVLIPPSRLVHFEKSTRIQKPAPKINLEKSSRIPRPEPLAKKQEVVLNKSEPKDKQKIKIIYDDSDEEQEPTKSPPEKHRDAIKKWISNPDNRSKHQVRDYCTKLNNNVIKNPSQATMKKHNIVFEDGKYVIKK